MAAEVEVWLDSFGMKRYFSKFMSSGFEKISFCQSLDEECLAVMEIGGSDAKVILSAARDLKANGGSIYTTLDPNYLYVDGDDFLSKELAAEKRAMELSSVRRKVYNKLRGEEIDLCAKPFMTADVLALHDKDSVGLILNALKPRYSYTKRSSLPISLKFNDPRKIVSGCLSSVAESLIFRFSEELHQPYTLVEEALSVIFNQRKTEIDRLESCKMNVAEVLCESYDPPPFDPQLTMGRAPVARCEPVRSQSSGEIRCPQSNGEIRCRCEEHRAEISSSNRVRCPGPRCERGHDGAARCEGVSHGVGSTRDGASGRTPVSPETTGLHSRHCSHRSQHHGDPSVCSCRRGSSWKCFYHGAGMKEAVFHLSEDQRINLMEKVRDRDLSMEACVAAVEAVGLTSTNATSTTNLGKRFGSTRTKKKSFFPSLLSKKKTHTKSESSSPTPHSKLGPRSISTNGEVFHRCRGMGSCASAHRGGILPLTQGLTHSVSGPVGLMDNQSGPPTPDSVCSASSGTPLLSSPGDRWQEHVFSSAASSCSNGSSSSQPSSRQMSHPSSHSHGSQPHCQAPQSGNSGCKSGRCPNCLVFYGGELVPVSNMSPPARVETSVPISQPLQVKTGGDNCPPWERNNRRRTERESPPVTTTAVTVAADVERRPVLPHIPPPPLDTPTGTLADHASPRDAAHTHDVLLYHSDSFSSEGKSSAQSSLSSSRRIARTDSTHEDSGCYDSTNDITGKVTPPDNKPVSESSKVFFSAPTSPVVMDAFAFGIPRQLAPRLPHPNAPAVQRSRPDSEEVVVDTPPPIPPRPVRPVPLPRRNLSLTSA